MASTRLPTLLLGLAALAAVATEVSAQTRLQAGDPEHIRLTAESRVRLVAPLASTTLQPPAFAGQLGSTNVNILVSLNRVDVAEAGTLITLLAGGFLRVQSSPAVAGAVLPNGNYALRLTIVHIVNPTTISWRAFPDFPNGPTAGSCQLPQSLLYNQLQACELVVPVTSGVLDFAASWGDNDGLVVKNVVVRQLR